MKHVFIINPRAGKGKALELIRPQIEAYINEHNLDAEIHVRIPPMPRRTLFGRRRRRASRFAFMPAAATERYLRRSTAHLATPMRK